MHILLISPPHKNLVTTTIPTRINKERGYQPPLGLLYLASYLKQNSGHRITVIDSEAEGLDYPQLKQRIEQLRPDLVGVQALTFLLIDALKTAAIVKSYSRGIPVVFGGPHVTIYPRESLRFKDVDFVVRGEGEISFKELIDNLGNEDGMRTVSGIGFKSRDNFILTQDPSFINDLDRLPFPDRRFSPYQKYYSLLSRNFPITTMMTSRGCPYNCIYCERMGKKFRAVSAQKVIEEIEHCLSLGIKEIFFHDDTFTIDKKRVFDICGLIHRKGLKFDWDARVRVDTVNYDLLSAMKKSGCRRLSFGVESGNARVLKNLRKGITIEQIRAAFAFAKKLKIQTLADFMIGSPGESKSDVLETIRFAKQLGADYAQFSVTTPYPGTDLYREALARGIVKSDTWREFALEPRCDFNPPLWTENLSRQELIGLLDTAYKSFYLSWKFAVKELRGIRSPKELFTKIKAGFKLFRK